MKKLAAFLIATFMYFLLFSCNATEPDPEEEDPPTIYPIVDVFLEEAADIYELWIKVGISDTLENNYFKLFMNKQEHSTFSLNAESDTVIYFDKLKAGAEYKFYGILFKDTLAIDTTKEIALNTYDILPLGLDSDTVFVPQPGEFKYLNFLNDVEIINENDIWVVGVLKYEASPGSTSTYSGMHWDGIKWEPYTIYNKRGWPMAHFSIEMIDGKLYSTDRGNLSKYENGVWTELIEFRHPAIKPIDHLFGFDEKNIFFAGEKGSFLKYNGSVIEKIESGTDIDFYDIWGDKATGIIWAAGYGLREGPNPVKSQVIEYRDGKASVIFDADSVDGCNYIFSIWSCGRKLHIVSDYRYLTYNFLDDRQVKNVGYVNGTPTKIRGTSPDYIQVAGWDGDIWQKSGDFIVLIDQYLFDQYSSIDVTKEITVAVGGRGNGYLIEFFKPRK